MPLTDDEVSLTLRQRLAIALVPSTVPAGVLIIALGVGASLGILSPLERSAFEQIAGGALLITYVKEIFPQLLGHFDEVVESFGPTTKATRKWKHRKAIALWTVAMTAIMISTIVQEGFAGFPGFKPFSRHKACDPNVDPTPAVTDGHIFTAGDTVPYFLGFMVDGVVLAYDDNPIKCNAKLLKRLILSGVLAFDNFLDGFGLVPVLRDAFGDGWWLVMLAFSWCVLLGATLTAALRHYVASPTFHLVWFTFSTVSIVDGALQLTKMGFTIYVALGVMGVWFFLLIGDLCDDENEDEADDEATQSGGAQSGAGQASVKSQRGGGGGGLEDQLGGDGELRSEKF